MGHKLKVKWSGSFFFKGWYFYFLILSFSLFFFSLAIELFSPTFILLAIGGSSVLKPGPARRVDPGPGRPGPGIGPGGGKNPLGNWPGETRSTRDPVHPVKPGWDPINFFFYCQSLNDVVFILLNAKTLKTMWRTEKNEAKSFTIGKPNLVSTNCTRCLFRLVFQVFNYYFFHSP